MKPSGKVELLIISIRNPYSHATVPHIVALLGSTFHAAKIRTLFETCKDFRLFFADGGKKDASVDAEVFGDETHLAGGVTVAVTVPARLLQRRHQLRTAVDVLTQFLHGRLHLPGVRRINTGQLPFQIFTIFYHNTQIMIEHRGSEFIYK